MGYAVEIRICIDRTCKENSLNILSLLEPILQSIFRFNTSLFDDYKSIEKFVSDSTECFKCIEILKLLNLQMGNLNLYFFFIGERTNDISLGIISKGNLYYYIYDVDSTLQKMCDEIDNISKLKLQVGSDDIHIYKDLRSKLLNSVNPSESYESDSSDEIKESDESDESDFDGTINTTIYSILDSIEDISSLISKVSFLDNESEYDERYDEKYIQHKFVTLEITNNDLIELTDLLKHDYRSTHSLDRYWYG